MIPTTTRQEISLTSIGDENNPQSIICKNTLWTVSFGSRFFLKEFGGQLYFLPNTGMSKDFVVTDAKNPVDGSIMLDRFWIWSKQTDGTIKVFEIEPSVAMDPIIHNSYTFESSVGSFDVSVVDGLWSSARGVLLKNGARSIFILRTPFTTPLLYTETVEWIPSMSSRVGSLSSGLNTLYTLHLDGTPDNENVEEYVYPPLNSAFCTENTPFSNLIHVVWEPVDWATSYVLEGSDSDDFAYPYTVYEGVSASTNDTVRAMGMHYYRVAARHESGLQSNWIYSQIETHDNRATVSEVGVERSENYVCYIPVNSANLNEWSPEREEGFSGRNSISGFHIHIGSAVSRGITVEFGDTANPADAGVGVVGVEIDSVVERQVDILMKQ